MILTVEAWVTGWYGAGVCSTTCAPSSGLAGSVSTRSVVAASALFTWGSLAAEIGNRRRAQRRVQDGASRLVGGLGGKVERDSGADTGDEPAD
jgi:hypothetical protein